MRRPTPILPRTFVAVSVLGLVAATTGCGSSAARSVGGNQGGASGAGGHGTSSGGAMGGAMASSSSSGAGAATSSSSSSSSSSGATSCTGGKIECGATCVDPTVDPANCGGCNKACTGGQVCSGGACACPAGQTLCGASCVDEQSNPANCGGCAKACMTGYVCSAGACALSCGAGTTNCSDACVSTSSDPNNCGTCGTTCSIEPNAAPACAGGTCGVACLGTYADCNGNPADGCEVDTSGSAANCGACGNACPSGANSTPTCASGTCAITCAAGFADCNKNPADGCEVALGTVTDCASCGNLCTAGAEATAACTGGACTYACAAGYLDCDMMAADGCEVNGQTDTSNCGTCGKVCPTPANATSTCVAGACGMSCAVGYLDCDMMTADGCEVNGQTDPANCNGCGQACVVANATAGCAAGACTVASCDAGFTDCDMVAANGCEVATGADPTNCGGCGFKCSTKNVATAGCAGGVCAPLCTAPFLDCSAGAGNVDTGCTVNSGNDVTNCGACGNVCAAGDKCCSGGCQNTTNCALTIRSIAASVGWQNGGDYVTIKGTGFGVGVQVYFADGRAPAWAKDAQTIIVQTPPHPVSLVDVKVVQGADTVIVHNGFQYLANGLTPPWVNKPMSKVRGEDPAIAVMQDGRVLVTGGTTVPDSPANCLATAEIYDPVAGTVSLAAGPMSATRMHHSAITLLTGKVLVVGGPGWGPTYGGTTSAAADLFDPTTNTFAPTSHPLNTARAGMRSILMVDGRVLITSDGQATAEIYDPIADTFTQISMAAAHSLGFIARARDGRVLVGGGDGGQAKVEAFDPTTGAFSATGTLNTARAMLSVHTLPDSRIVVIGGTNASAGGVNAPQKTMEFWSPTTGAWTFASVQLVQGRSWHASALVRDGTILVMGGYPTAGSCTPTNTVEQFDPVAGTVVPFPTLPSANAEWTAATLLDGSVIGVGGGACGTPTALPDLDFLQGAP